MATTYTRYSSGGWPYVYQTADCSYPCEVVTQQWKSSFDVAANAFNQMELFLFDLVNTGLAYMQVPTIPINLPTIGTTIPGIDKGDKPDSGDYDLNFRAPDPVPGVILDPISPIDTSGAPDEFTKAAPTPVYGDEPAPLSADKPGDAPTVDIPEFTDAPNYIIPDVPTLRQLNLPSAPTIETLIFDGVLPESGLVAPEIQFNWSEEMYASELLTEINNNFLNTLQNGSSGLPADIEELLWQRARDRLTEASEAQKQEVYDSFATRGFDMPNGVIVDAIMRVLETRYRAEANLTREVYVDQAKRAWDFTVTALQLGIQMENMLMDYTNSMMNRLFEAEKFSLEAVLNIFNAKVELFKLELSSYQIAADVFKIRVEAQLAELEKYKAQLEGQKLVNEINKSDVDLYVASLTGLQTSVELYKTEIQAEVEKVKAQAIGVDAYKTQVEAYIAQIQAYATEWDAYKARISGEVAKIGAYEAEVNAYGSRVSSYKTIIEARSLAQQGEIESNKAKVLEFQANVDRVKSQLEAETARLGAEASAFDSEVKAYVASLSAEEAAVKAAGIKYEAEVQNAMNSLNLELKKAEVEMNNAGMAAKNLMASYETASKVYSSVGSAALATVSAGSSISQSSGATIEELTKL